MNSKTNQVNADNMRMRRRKAKLTRISSMWGSRGTHALLLLCYNLLYTIFCLCNNCKHGINALCIFSEKKILKRRKNALHNFFCGGFANKSEHYCSFMIYCIANIFHPYAYHQHHIHYHHTTPGPGSS